MSLFRTLCLEFNFDVIKQRHTQHFRTSKTSESPKQVEKLLIEIDHCVNFSGL